MRRRTDLAKSFDHRIVPAMHSSRREQRIYQRYSTMGDKYRDLYQNKKGLIGSDQIGLRQGIYS